MKPLACVVHGIEEANIKLGDNVAVIGTSTVGLIFVKLSNFKGAYIITEDLNK